MPSLKTLQPGDEGVLETFLSQYPDTSMFLRSNLQAAGLVNQGARFQGTYVAAIEDEVVTAVAAHYWNGMIVIQAPIHLESVVQEVVSQSGKTISGITGPTQQVEAAREVLGLANRPIRLSESEILFSLALQDLRVPTMLTSGQVQCRLPHLEELELLTEWCIAYSVEALEQVNTPSLHQNCYRTIEARQATATHWVLVAEETLVSYSAFNACLPEIVQIGGVWTPPNLRGKGYAKCVVAGSLISAQSQKVNRAVLFTSEHNIAAQAVYRGLGFQLLLEKYGLLIFKDESE
ncbi:GNAT family N-acetyltransferase [Scytonema sp. NUACC26]|uniref:GNAT family N-acetyltransferase n=1 Tax=Scytonema sp. NUACC26 TaxID=3140176 RepID=UPI0034DC91B2